MIYVVTLLVLALALPDALLNRPYAPEPEWENVSTRCAMPVPALRVVEGALPPGLRLSSRGEWAGVPTAPGAFAFTVEISDGCAHRREERQIRVVPAPILVAEADVTDFHCPQGTRRFSAGVVRISGSIPGRAYSVDTSSSNDPAHGAWLETAMREGVIPAAGLALEADAVELTINPEKLVPGTYFARLRISTWQGANAPELQFRLRVDSPQAVLGAIAPPLASFPIEYRITEAPGDQVIVPPPVPRIIPPFLPRYSPSPKQGSKAGRGNAHSVGRSRVLPFPKVTIGDKPLPRKPIDPKPAAKVPDKKEAPPERTKPSAMPPAPAASARSQKPAPGH